MAVEAGAAYISVVAETSKFAKTVKGALGDFQSQATEATTGKRGFGSMLASGFKVAGVAAGGFAAVIGGIAAKKGLDRALNIQQATAKLTGLGHSAKDVDKIMGNALASVKGTAFGLGDAATVAASAVAAGVKPGKDLTRTLKLTADAATIAGVGMGDMGAIFNKVAASNKVQMDVINQLQDAGVPALALIAKQMHVTQGAAAEMVSDGKVNFATFENAMQKGMGGAALESGNTAQGAWANMMAALGRVGEKLVSKVLPYAQAFFGQVIKWADAAGPFVEKFADFMGDKIGTVMDWLKTNALPILGNLRDWFVNKGLPAVQAFGGWITDTGLPAVQSLVTMFKDKALPAIQAFGGWLKDNLLPYVMDIVSAFKDHIIPAITGFVSQMRDGRDAGGGFVTTVKNIATWLKSAATWLLQNRTLVWGLVGAFVAWKAVQGAINLGQWVVDLGRSAAAFITKAAAVAVDTGAAIANAAAWAASKAETVALMAMYAKDFVVAVARTTAGWVANTASMVANKVVTLAVSIATKAATAAWWLMNAAMSANPIGLVVAAIALLVAGLVLFFTKTEIGRKVWSALVEGFKAGWTWVQNAFKVGAAFVITWLGKAWDFIKKVWSYSPLGLITGNWDKIMGFFKSLPGKVKTVFDGVKEAIVNAFKAAFNFVSRLWNNSLGKIGFTIPSWVPVVGGKEWKFPQMPYLADGGTALTAGWSVVGERGPELLHMNAGASVVPLDHPASASALGGASGMSAADVEALVKRAVSEALSASFTTLQRLAQQSARQGVTA